MTGLFVENDDQGPAAKIGHRAKGWVAVLISLAVLVGGGWLVADKVAGAWNDFNSTEDFTGNGTDAIVVTIPKGSSLTTIGDLLVKDGVIKSQKAWRAAADEVSNANEIQAGRFNLKKQLPAKTAMTMLLDPKNIVRVTVTIPEGLRMTDQWPLIEKATGVTVKSLQDAAKDPKALGLPAWAKNNPEGLLYPETYNVDTDPTAAEVMSMQVKQFIKVSGELKLEQTAKSLKLTPEQVLTIASIIEKESGDPKYQPQVASVIYNRLAKDMKLELDSTVIFANNVKGQLTTTDEQRANPSPYNTYVHPGLPPGPISNPGESALTAALHPAQTDFLYFVAVNPKTGETKFAKTAEEHNKNVAQFQQWCQANKGVC